MVIAGLRSSGWTGGRLWTVVAVVAGVFSLMVTAVLAGTGGIGGANASVAVEAGALLVPTFLAARTGRGRSGTVATAVVALAGPVALLRLSPVTPELLSGVAGWALVSAVVVGAGLYLRMLDERRERSVREARRAQRLRLAADLHDFVAHDVSEILARAQAGQVLAAQNRDAALDQLSGVEAAAHRALAALDRTVTVLDAPDGGPLTGPDGGDADRQRPQAAPTDQGGAVGRTVAAGGPGPLPGIEDIPGLVERFAAVQGVSATAEVTPAAATVSRESSLTIYRVVAETLTNVRRHAQQPRSVRVAVQRVGPGAVEVVVEDDGAAHRRSGTRAFGGHRPAGGRGLPGLAGQVGALGGELVSGPRPDGPGWRVAARLPADRQPA